MNIRLDVCVILYWMDGILITWKSFSLKSKWLRNSSFISPSNWLKLRSSFVTLPVMLSQWTPSQAQQECHLFPVWSLTVSLDLYHCIEPMIDHCSTCFCGMWLQIKVEAKEVTFVKWKWSLWKIVWIGEEYIIQMGIWFPKRFLLVWLFMMLAHGNFEVWLFESLNSSKLKARLWKSRKDLELYNFFELLKWERYLPIGRWLEYWS